ncbi:MAG: hypothetical protein QNJ75_01160 [Acidimicrobiia bacterium]|nr:hypothetical protein [Acidimicrobiia bacterium]
MQTMEKVQSTETPPRSADRNSWLLVAVALLAIAVVALGSLWLGERSTVSDLESQLEAAETAAAEIASTSHPQQAEVRALYDDFIAAIADPDAETVASLFMPAALHVDGVGIETRGAEVIGRAYEGIGPLEAINTDAVIVVGESTLRAAMRGQVEGVDGLLVTSIVPTQDGLKFSKVIWFGR